MLLNTTPPSNQAPVAAADYSQFGSDTPLVVAALGVLGNDTDGDVLTAVQVSGPSNGTLTLDSRRLVRLPAQRGLRRQRQLHLPGQ